MPKPLIVFSSVQFSCSVVSDSLRPHESQHARPPCPSPTPGVHPNSCASSRWCHPTISFSVIPFSSCPQSLPALGSFPMSQLFTMRWPKCWSFSLSISPFDCVDHNKLWKILKEVGISVHLTCLLRYLHAGQEATVRTGHGTTDWFHIGKRVHPGSILSPCLFNFYAEYIMRNAWLEETQAGIKIAGRNINHLRYADDTTLMAESEEELKILLMKVKEENKKVGLKLNIQKTKIMASGPITSW